jgi:protein SCO1/2
VAVGAAAVALVLIASGALLWRARSQPVLPVLFALPPFNLVDERGEAFGSAQLAGRPYVADFIYTSCRDSCPLLTARMGELQDLLQADPGSVRLVTFTVDPAHDSPERLAAYARDARAVPGLWTFVTGPVGEVSSLLRDGFKVPVEPDGEPAGEPAGERGGERSAEVDHDSHLVLVDGKGRIRGYFGASPEGIARIRSALKELLL